MPAEEVLILAMTRMQSGICTAGFTREPDATTGLRWVRPVKEHDSLILGDMTDRTGRVVQCSDVVELNLKEPRPQPPHTEDWLTDFIYQPPSLSCRLEGEKRADLFAQRLDRAPEDVLVRHTRSLCLIQPDSVHAWFSMDPHSGKYEARMGFRLGDLQHERANSARGVPVTDIKWRALGRTWLDESAGELVLDGSELAELLGATHIYLALGLTRRFRGKCWLMIVGVHVIPDYDAAIDYSNL